MNRIIQLLILCLCVVGLNGHARMMDPPARNSMWRLGYSNPTNYNDNEVFCGGFGVQFLRNKGKCGVCGDNWADDQPRPHEGGGRYGQGVIGRRYTTGQNISILIDVTTNHQGWFITKLCPVDNPDQIVTQECFDQHVLPIAGTNNDKYYIPKDTPKTAMLEYEVTLPVGVTCSQCVIQWTWKSGNTWGTCKNGTEGMGCGDQEMFRNCADIQIYSSVVGYPPNAIDIPSAIYLRDSSAPTGRRPLIIKYQVCVPTEQYANDTSMVGWCQENCLSYPPNCPKDRCYCPNDCTAVGRLAGQEGTDVYCHRQCLRYPSNCPKDECKCVEKIDPKDPSIVLDRSSINIEKDFVTNYTNQNGHKVEEFEDHGDKYKVISVN